MNITNGELSIVYDKTGLSFQYSCDFGFTFDSGDDDGDNIILIACDVVGYPTEPPPSCSGKLSMLRLINCFKNFL